MPALPNIYVPIMVLGKEVTTMAQPIAGLHTVHGPTALVRMVLLQGPPYVRYYMNER